MLTCPVAILKKTVAILTAKELEALCLWLYTKKVEIQILGPEDVPESPDGLISIEMSALGPQFEAFLKALDAAEKTWYGSVSYYSMTLRVRVHPEGTIEFGTLKADSRGHLCRELESKTKWSPVEEGRWEIAEITFRPLSEVCWTDPGECEPWGKVEREEIHIVWKLSVWV